MVQQKIFIVEIRPEYEITLEEMEYESAAAANVQKANLWKHLFIILLNY